MGDLTCQSCSRPSVARLAKAFGLCSRHISGVRFQIMPTVLITGWNEGFQKVEHTKLLKTFAGLSLSDAKHATDAVLEGNSISVFLPTDQAASAFVLQLQELGAIAKLDSEENHAT